VVIPVKDNLPLTSALVAQLRDQVLVAAPWSSASPTADDSWMVWVPRTVSPSLISMFSWVDPQHHRAVSAQHDPGVALGLVYLMRVRVLSRLAAAASPRS
jgi:hypothetical protein